MKNIESSSRQESDNTKRHIFSTLLASVAVIASLAFTFGREALDVTGLSPHADRKASTATQAKLAQKIIGSTTAKPAASFVSDSNVRAALHAGYTSRFNGRSSTVNYQPLYSGSDKLAQKSASCYASLQPSMIVASLKDLLKTAAGAVLS